MPGCPVPLTLADFAWLYVAGAWLLLIAGLALLLWSLFWDRARGRRRCPKCWYDMAGVPGLRCPECGRAWKSERKLRKTRRRWRVAAVGGVMLVLSRAAWLGLEIQSRGLPAATPTTILLFWAGDVEFDPILLGWTAEYPAPKSEMNGELRRRYKNGDLYAWQQAIVSRSNDACGPEGWVGAVRMRDRWPADVPLTLWINDDFFKGYFDRKLVVTPMLEGVGPIVEILPDTWWRSSHPTHARLETGRSLGIPLKAGGPVRVRVELFERGRGDGKERFSVRLWSRTLEFPVQLVPSSRDILKRGDWAKPYVPVELSLFAVLPGGEGWASVRVRANDFARVSGITFGLGVEFLHGGEVVAWADACIWQSRYKGEGIIRGDIERLAAADLKDPRWTVRVRGDPDVALRDLGAETYWGGGFEMLLSAVPREP